MVYIDVHSSILNMLILSLILHMTLFRIKRIILFLVSDHFHFFLFSL